MTKYRNWITCFLFLLLTLASGFAARGHFWSAPDVESCTVHWHEVSAGSELPCCQQPAAGDHLLPPGFDSAYFRLPLAAVPVAALPPEPWRELIIWREAGVFRDAGGPGMLGRQREQRSIVLRL